MNCVGGLIRHELGLRFNTPTIDLWFNASGYVRFLSKLDWYLSRELKEIVTSEVYPVGMLDDIKVFFMHYSPFEEASAKWRERCTRINRENLYVMMVEGAGCTEETVKEFDRLPYKNKVIFTGKEYPNVESAIHIPGSGQLSGEVIDLCRYKSKFTGKRWIDEFDNVNFFNSGKREMKYEDTALCTGISTL